ncbi:hypothetical protein BMETH_721_0 [methanotrophic bacterial endosymbiont of Bathymodiolus sp.]|nr:hypothetical protein BMETH_721_0 [methanotrophic bacterial endosymbiont of Bathymodiolus sp.]
MYNVFVIGCQAVMSGQRQRIRQRQCVAEVQISRA